MRPMEIAARLPKLRAAMADAERQAVGDRRADRAAAAATLHAMDA